MISVFFLCRNVWGAFLLVDFWKKAGQEMNGVNPDPKPPGAKLSKVTVWTFRGGGIVMTCLNTLWFTKMLQGAAK
eukprot:scaffold651897_cov39-Prasinocladus_malaysianus.AAC.1